MPDSKKIDEHWKLVEAANYLSDPLDQLVSFQKYDKNGLNLSFSCIKKANLDDEVLQWAFNLTKSNMEDLYTSSWGWNDKEKMKELTDDRMWFLLAMDQDSKPVAFSSFRFDLDFGEPVVYCYEIQLEMKVQRKGLGKMMMQILQLFALKNQMSKVVSTVLNCNETSKGFFMGKLRYEVDETSPEGECYVILSKKTKSS
uniref:N-alpha-acetyltransferase 40 isoform X3 n=1 Tax=Ciona intestinalis TaxID=7719 RepID=UPI000EF4A394|nr:N-alpha-acetyltransferase 40 isoform X3 [Ciona intestinalis]|eukprot:XP_026693187.1 N-alpha-acetyltransferase 40 isoform X3 [Ciona intestinalis]